MVKSSKKRKDGREFIDLSPTGPERVRLAEGLSVTQVDYLIRLGLGDPDKITWYRQAIMHPDLGMSNPAIRKYVVEVYSKLLDIVVNDVQMYNRLKFILQRRHGLQEETADEVEPTLMSRIRRAIGDQFE